ncbi:MAG: hypothetical protein GDA48_27465 [Hormoscilla sp. GM102CHS1]|nr:hypothetical protein [Hormoscilla sp. GM102CHS1]
MVNCLTIALNLATSDGNQDYQIRISLQVGDGGLLQLYLHELEVQLGRERFRCPVGFYSRLGVKFNVLGKRRIFDRFKIGFQQDPGLLTFES